jgi:hypothetical protein
MTTNLSVDDPRIEKLYCRFTEKSKEGNETGICSFRYKKMVGTIWDMYYFKRLGDFDVTLEVSESWIGDTHTFEPIHLKDLQQEMIQMKLGLENSIGEVSKTIDHLKTENKKIEIQFFEKILLKLQFCISELTKSQKWISNLKLNDDDYVPVEK